MASRRRVVAATVGGYVGLGAAALCCGIELGIQPTLFHDAAGAPLYSPYHLSQAVPAMLLAHLVVAGVVEGLLTGGVIAYLQRANSALLQLNPGIPVRAWGAAGAAGPRPKVRPVVVALAAMAVLVVLTPLGLLAPGAAFGEDAPQDLDLSRLGLKAVPAGLAKYTGFWRHTLLGDYGFSDGSHPLIGYVVSAVVGIGVVGLAVFLIAAVIGAASRRGSATAAGSQASVPAEAGS